MNLISKHQLYVGMYLPNEVVPVPAALMKFERVNANEEGVFELIQFRQWTVPFIARIRHRAATAKP